jgi:hypothetical protein
VRLKTKHAKVSGDLSGAFEIIAYGNAAFAGHELGPRHATGPLQRLFCRLDDEKEKHGAFARALPNSDGVAQIRVSLANFDIGIYKK